MSWIMSLALWMDKRFPAKVVVIKEEYDKLQSSVAALHEELSLLRNTLSEHKLIAESIGSRMTAMENAAVHKGAVQDVISVVKGLKEELQAVKMGLGLSRMAQAADPLATFNDEIVGESHNV